MEKIFEIPFDKTKNDLSLSLEFFGAMNLGYAMTLLDDATAAPLWTPEIKKDTIADDLTTVKRQYLIMKPLSQSKDMFFMLQGLCRGLDINNFPKFRIILSILQNGNIVNQFTIDGDLKTDWFEITINILFKS